MQPTTDNQLEQRFELLPEAVIAPLISSSTTLEIDHLASIYHLSDEQSNILSITVSMILFGEIYVDEFEEALMESIGLPEKVVKNIAESINEKIFKNITEELKQVYNFFHSSYYEDMEIGEEELTPIDIELPGSQQEEVPLVSSRPLPAVSQSQQPITALIEDHQHLAAHNHDDGPIPLSKNGMLRTFHDGNDPHADEPTYELK